MKAIYSLYLAPPLQIIQVLLLKKPIIHVDFDPMALSKFHKVEVALWGEIGTTCKMLGQELAGKTNTIDQRPEVAARWKIWKDEKKNRLNDDQGKGISSIAVFDVMNRVTPENAVIAVDIGNNTYSFGRYFECKNQSVLMSGYLGSIGYAWAAVKNTRPVWSVSGDGGLGIRVEEIEGMKSAMQKVRDHDGPAHLGIVCDVSFI